RLQAVRIETQSLQDRRRDLHGLHRAGDCFWREVRVRQEHHHVGVVMRETTMFRQLLCAAGIRNADVRGHDDVWRTRIRSRGKSWCVEAGTQGWPGEDL